MRKLMACPFRLGCGSVSRAGKCRDAWKVADCRRKAWWAWRMVEIFISKSQLFCCHEWSLQTQALHGTSSLWWFRSKPGSCGGGSNLPLTTKHSPWPFFGKCFGASLVSYHHRPSNDVENPLFVKRHNTFEIRIDFVAEKKRRPPFETTGYWCSVNSYGTHLSSFFYLSNFLQISCNGCVVNAHLIRNFSCGCPSVGIPLSSSDSRPRPPDLCDWSPQLGNSSMHWWRYGMPQVLQGRVWTCEAKRRLTPSSPVIAWLH